MVMGEMEEHEQVEFGWIIDSERGTIVLRDPKGGPAAHPLTAWCRWKMSCSSLVFHTILF